MDQVWQWPFAREKAYSNENAGLTTVLLLGVFIDSLSLILQVLFAPVLQTSWLRYSFLFAKAKRARERRYRYRLEVPFCLYVTASEKWSFTEACRENEYSLKHLIKNLSAQFVLFKLFILFIVYLFSYFL